MQILPVVSLCKGELMQYPSTVYEIRFKNNKRVNTGNSIMYLMIINFN